MGSRWPANSLYGTLRVFTLRPSGGGFCRCPAGLKSDAWVLYTEVCMVYGKLDIPRYTVKSAKAGERRTKSVTRSRRGRYCKLSELREIIEE